MSIMYTKAHQCDNAVKRRSVLAIKGHVFDEAHLQWLLLCQRHKIQQLVLIEASHDHTVHLQREAHNDCFLYVKLPNTT